MWLVAPNFLYPQVLSQLSYLSDCLNVCFSVTLEAEYSFHADHSLQSSKYLTECYYSALRSYSLEVLDCTSSQYCEHMMVSIMVQVKYYPHADQVRLQLLL